MTDNRQTVVAAFTEMAPRYEETVDRELRQFWGVGYEEFIERVLAPVDLVRAGIVLDVATGRGAIPLALARRGWQGRAIGLDITPEMLRGSRQRAQGAGNLSNTHLTCASGERLPFARGTFDVAICALATHHMHAPQLLREMHRVLRPGGELLVADVALAEFWDSHTGRFVLHSLAWWYGRREGGARMAAEMDALPNMRTPEQWCALLSETGFSDFDVTAVPARHRWYPPGILIDARSVHSSRS